MNKGFTLIEMIVAIGLFSVVMMLSMAGFLNISDLQKKSSAIRVSNDNMNFAMETMSREIRTGSSYSEGADNSLHFTSISSNNMVYSLNNITHQIEISKDGGASFSPLTSSELEISKLKFVIKGEGSGDGQPNVTIIMEGSSGVSEKTKSYLNLQTTVTQRKIDLNK